MREYTEDWDRSHVYEFDSYTEAVEFAGTRASLREADRKSMRTFDRSTHAVYPDGRTQGMKGIYDGLAWAGTATWADAVEVALHGWPEGAARLVKSRDLISDRVRPKGKRQEVAYSIVGPGTLDINRLIMGHPEPYMVWQETDDVIDAPAQGVLRICVNRGASYAEGEQAIFDHGAGVAVLVDALEEAGFRCEVVMSSVVGQDNGYSISAMIPIKAADQPLELETMAFWLCHPSALRRISFGIREHAPAEIRQRVKVVKNSTYGTPQDLDWRQQEEFDIYIGARVGAHDDMVEWVSEMLTKQGVEVEGYAERKAAEEAAREAWYAAARERAAARRADPNYKEAKPMTQREQREVEAYWRRQQRERDREA